MAGLYVQQPGAQRGWAVTSHLHSFGASTTPNRNVTQLPAKDPTHQILYGRDIGGWAMLGEPHLHAQSMVWLFVESQVEAFKPKVYGHEMAPTSVWMVI